MINEEDKQKLDNLLCEIDDTRIAQGFPILSILVRHDDGAVSTAFWNTIKKHNLRLPDEDDETLIKRMTQLAWTQSKEPLE